MSINTNNGYIQLPDGQLLTRQSYHVILDALAYMQMQITRINLSHSHLLRTMACHNPRDGGIVYGTDIAKNADQLFGAPVKHTRHRRIHFQPK